MTHLPARPAWYGKLPALGDFASRRLPGGMIDRWHDWVGSALVASRSALGEDWTARYEAAPAFAFLVGPGVLDLRAWTGVMMASADRVGRRFPLMVAVPATPVLSWHERLARHRWYDDVAATIDAWIVTRADVDRIEADLGGCICAPEGIVDRGEARPSASIPDPSTPGSTWWPVTRPGTVHRFRAMPPAAAFVAFLDPDAAERTGVTAPEASVMSR